MSRMVTAQSGAARAGRLAAALAALALLLALGAGSAAASRAPDRAAPPASAPSSPPTLTVGSQLLRRCQTSPAAYCGTLRVPLDHSSPAGPLIAVAYRWFPASAPGGGGAAGTVVPVEGGPGYPSIGSAPYYAQMYGPLLQRWNMLTIDNRGTGHSTPIDCPELQDFSGPTAGEAFQAAAARCAGALNARWHYPGGAPVHASDLFTSAAAADDMAQVITALGLHRVDLYGDSYGSFYAQVFASRFPRLVRSVILDSTYLTIGLDPWYRSTVQSMPADFDAACSRWAPCAQVPGTAWERIGMVAALLRAAPISGVVPGPAGRLERVSMNVVGLVDLINDAAGDPQIYREIDAADRALLQDRDPAPLLRLYLQRLFEDESYFGAPASEYSAGLYLAVSCLDYPQLFSMAAAPAVRGEEFAAAQSALPPATFSPFTTAEWLQQDQNTEAYSACLDWPAPTVAQPPVTGPAPILPASMPVLVLGGEFDTWTPPVDHPKVLAELGGRSRFIEIANSTHVVGEGDTVCGSTLVQEFVARPAALATLDDSCAPAAPAIHAVGVYPSALAQEPAIQPDPGITASPAALTLAAAAVSTAGDAVARYQAASIAEDHGLFGGTVTASRAGALLTLSGDELIPGVAVSGFVHLAPAAEPVDGLQVTSSLTVRSAGASGQFTASWTTAGDPDAARVFGSAGGEVVSGSTPAP